MQFEVDCSSAGPLAGRHSCSLPSRETDTLRLNGVNGGAQAGEDVLVRDRRCGRLPRWPVASFVIVMVALGTSAPLVGRSRRR